MVSIIDFLGHVVLGVDTQEPEVTTIAEATQRAYASALQYRWIEVARHAAVGYLIAGLQMCPIRITSATGKHLKDSEYIWNVCPNPNQNHSEFMARLIDQMYFGRQKKALVVPVRRASKDEIWVADGWTENNDRPGRPIIYENISIDGSTEVLRKPMPADKVYVFKVPETSRWRVLLQALEAVYDEMAKSAVEAFGDKNARRWLLDLDASITGTKEDQNNINAYLKDSVSSFVTGNDMALPLYNGMSLRRADVDSKNAGSMLDVLQIRQDSFRVVTNCLRIPYTFLEGNVNNFNTVFNEFLTFFLNPPAKAIADEIAMKTLNQGMWEQGGSVVVDTTHVRHVDLFEVADRVEKLVGSSIDTPNEIRAFTGQEPVDKPGMNEYQMTKNHERATGGGESNADSASADTTVG